MQLLEPLPIESVALDEMVFENTCGPYPKAHTIMRFDSVTNRNDDIKIVVINLIGLSIRRSCCKICNN